jgi:hypothetical protein
MGGTLSFPYINLQFDAYQAPYRMIVPDLVEDGARWFWS